MSLPSESRNKVRFGDYEIDLRTAELRTNGRKLILQGQPFQILLLLLERPGELVTREELRERLWRADTFVDFEHGLNKAVNRLRDFLNDRAEQPKFIETLPRRGYRFISPVTMPADPNYRPECQASTAESSSRATATVATQQFALLRDVFFIKSWRSIVLTLGIVVCVILALVFLVQTVRYRPPRITGYRQITHDGLPKSEFTIGVSGIVSDAERLYFQEIKDDRFVVSQVHVDGGEVAAVPSPFVNTLLFDISPNRAELLVGNLAKVSDISLWALPLPTGPARRLGNLSGQSATWCQDGVKIFFAKNSDIYSASNDGASQRQLATLTGWISGMRCSPDGLRLRFTLNDEKTNSHSLWEINTDGRNAHSLLAGSNDPLDACCGVWTSDGKYYVFQTHSRSGRKDLWVLREGRSWSAKRKGLTKLTNGPLAFDSPQSSRDGQKLFAIGLQPRSELVRYDARSGFVPYLGGISAAGVAFSKDGEWFTYTSATDGTLWRAKTDGSERFQLSYPPMDVIVPRWSPDGKQIAFSGTLPKKPRNSYLISSSGGVPQQIVPEAFTSSDPNWSPDGKSIVLWLADSGFINKRISIVDLASGKETRLPASEHLFSPRWSPDGRYIAAIAEDEQELVVFDRSTQQWVSLAKKRIGYPSWSHHGDFVYFDTLGENPAFFRVRISDLRLERLIDLKGSRRFWSVWEPWSGLAPDDSLLLQRDTSMEEIYALEWRTQ